MALRIERYKHTRHWALYDGADLVVVTVYRRGAREVQRRLAAQAPAATDAAAQAAAAEAARHARALARQAQAVAKAARARAQPGGEAGAAGGVSRRPSLAAPLGQAGRRRRDQRARRRRLVAPLVTMALARGESRPLPPDHRTRHALGSAGRASAWYLIAVSLQCAPDGLRPGVWGWEPPWSGDGWQPGTMRGQPGPLSWGSVGRVDRSAACRAACRVHRDVFGMVDTRAPLGAGGARLGDAPGSQRL